MNIIHLMTAKFLALCCLLSASLAISVTDPSELTSSFLQNKSTQDEGGICTHIGNPKNCDISPFGCHFDEEIGCTDNEDQPDILPYEDIGHREKKLLENFVAGEDLERMHTEEGMDLTMLADVTIEKQDLVTEMRKEVEDASATELIQQSEENLALVQTTGIFRDAVCRTFKYPFTCDNTVLGCQWNWSWWSWGCVGQHGDPPIFSWDSLGWAS